MNGLHLCTLLQIVLEQVPYTPVCIPTSGRYWFGDLSAPGSMNESEFPAAEWLSQGLSLVKDDLGGPTLASSFCYSCNSFLCEGALRANSALG